MRSVLYLHGFASSPRSEKPIALAPLLEPHGLAIFAPDLNVPSFENLSLEACVETAMLGAALQPPAAIVGSSHGAAVALEAIRRGVRAPTLLIAPAIGVSDLWLSQLPEGDRIRVWNHARGAEVSIHRDFFEQMSRFDADQNAPPVPIVIFMGTDDEIIPYERVRSVWTAWQQSGGLAEGSRFVAVEGGDHRLTAQIAEIAEAIRELAGAAGIRR